MRATQTLLLQARAFRRSHPEIAPTDRTFGYFTSHPVAPLNRKRLVKILTLLEERSERIGRKLRVLDLACGSGLITCGVAALGHKALGIDVSHEELALARWFATETGSTSEFWDCDLFLDPS